MFLSELPQIATGSNRYYGPGLLVFCFAEHDMNDLCIVAETSCDGQIETAASRAQEVKPFCAFHNQSKNNTFDGKYCHDMVMSHMKEDVLLRKPA